MNFSKIYDPYAVWENGLNPKLFLWQLNKKPVSEVRSFFNYSKGVLDFLLKKGELIESFSKVSDSTVEVKSSYYKSVGDCFLILYKKNLISISSSYENRYNIVGYHCIDDKSVLSEFNKFKVVPKKESAKVSILVSRGGRLCVNPIDFNAPKIDDLNLNYGKQFSEIHNKILEKLNARKHGIMLFHGSPGTGKSTYIKYLTSLCDREFIFIPVNMVDYLSSPDFISILLENKESVLILEDAEKAIESRDSAINNSAIATLLNISDGILGSLLDITIIVTYNADKQRIDKALTRKGRLSFDYDFGPLSIEDAKSMAQHLKKAVDVKEPMTLADIYNCDDINNLKSEEEKKKEEQKVMGFHTLIKR